MNKNILIVFMCVIAFGTLVRGITKLCNANIEQDILTTMKKSALSEKSAITWKEASYTMQYSNEKFGFDFLYPSDYYEKDQEGGFSFMRKDNKRCIYVEVTPYAEKGVFSAWQLYDSLKVEKIIFDFGEKKEMVRDVFAKGGYICARYIFLHRDYEYCISVVWMKEDGETNHIYMERELVKYSEQMLTHFRLWK